LLRQHAAGNPAVASMDATQQDLPARTARMTAHLQRLYARWCSRAA
jgi:hypothetical protein